MSQLGQEDSASDVSYLCFILTLLMFALSLVEKTEVVAAALALLVRKLVSCSLWHARLKMGSSSISFYLQA
jgi:hypothetical protein